ncbi:hypothetical protein DFH07DRAFT_824491 [Mycena maculata]|uniref:Uncharacterized protein n=1 Tax=Mycena maculata TaxID=230809 RepID=A0AAD7NBQ2_9AGAR|nr:hypothetical protein DFH07DRAFT_824491 [Mycena maculata]
MRFCYERHPNLCGHTRHDVDTTATSTRSSSPRPMSSHNISSLAASGVHSVSPISPRFPAYTSVAALSSRSIQVRSRYGNSIRGATRSATSGDEMRSRRVYTGVRASSVFTGPRSTCLVIRRLAFAGAVLPCGASPWRATRCSPTGPGVGGEWVGRGVMQGVASAEWFRRAAADGALRSRASTARASHQRTSPLPLRSPAVRWR